MMNTYMILKWAHIVSSVFMVGTGFASAFYLFSTNLTRNVQAIAQVSRTVVRADTFFTTPAVIFQPLSGFAMIALARMPWLDSGWILASLALYAVVVACWLPVLWLQLQMRNISQQAALSGAQTLPAAFWRCFLCWTLLGIPAFAATLTSYMLMVLKPF